MRLKQDPGGASDTSPHPHERNLSKSCVLGIVGSRLVLDTRLPTGLYFSVPEQIVMLAVGDSVSVPEALLLAFTTSQLAGLIFTYSTPPASL